MKYFIIPLLFATSCVQTDKEIFVEYACDLYEDCDFSKVERNVCEDFVSKIYDGNTPEDTPKCLDCLKHLGCRAWGEGHLCEDECQW